MTQKKLKLPFIGIGVSVVAFTLTAIGQKGSFVRANDPDYALEFNVGKNQFVTKTSATPSSGTAFPKTTNKNTVFFNYTNLFAGDSYSWQIFAANNSFFYNSDPINGLKSVTISFETHGKTFKVYWSETTDFDNTRCQEFTSSILEPTECVFDDQPCYVKIENTSQEQVKIGSVIYNYSCIAKYAKVTAVTEDYEKGYTTGSGTYVIGTTATINAIPNPGNVFVGWYKDDTLISESSSYSFTVPKDDTKFVAKFTHNTAWDDSHGVNPIISGDKKTLTYGLYPQTVVTNPDAGLIAAGANYGQESYFGYQDEYYVKDVANPSSEGSTFSDGTSVESGETYYFKCEPIKWNVVESVQGTVTVYTLDCSNILYGHEFNKYKSGTLCNLYSSSEIRTWLNNTFYQKAFSFNATPIMPVELSDAQVSNEKVWLGSTTQFFNTWYPLAANREKKTSDFAICNHAYYSTSLYARNGTYWTRTPDTNNWGKDYYVSLSGSLDNTVQVDDGTMGASPCLKIKV